MKVHVEVIVWSDVFIFLGKYLEVQLLAHMMCMSNFVGHRYTVIQSDV